MIGIIGAGAVAYATTHESEVMLDIEILGLQFNPYFDRPGVECRAFTGCWVGFRWQGHR